MEAPLGRGHGWGVVFLDIQLFVLGGRQVIERFVEARTVIEADSGEHLVLGVLEGREATSVDELRLEGRDLGLGHRVVVGVAA